MVLRAHDIPADIWLQIASYMHSRDVERLVLLNRTFADLAALSQRERRQTLVLNTNTHCHYGNMLKVALDCIITADEIAKQLKERLPALASHLKPSYPSSPTNGLSEAEGYLPLKRLVLHYRPHPPPHNVVPKLSSWLEQLRAELKARRTYTTLERRLRKLYARLGTVESLTFVHIDGLQTGGARSLDVLYTGALWQAVAANLRELNIVVDANNRIFAILSCIPADVSLSRLEVLRFSYGKLGAGLNAPSEPKLERLRALLVESASTLNTLEIRIHGYQYGYSQLFEQFFPAVVQFRRLRCLSLVISPFSPASVPSTSTVKLWRFVERHSRTLTSIKLHGLPIIYQHLVENGGSAASTRNGGVSQSSVAISIQVMPDDQIFSAGMVRHNLPAVRQSLVELCIVHPYSMFLPGLNETLPNLRRLVLLYRSYSPDLVATLALQAPLLVSLSFRYFYRRSDEVGPTTRKQESTVLANWRLKDISIYRAEQNALQGYYHTIPAWSHMRQLAGLVPSIESFFGTGHMQEEFERGWKYYWPWRRNMYLDMGNV
ncbi:hypothetical protein BKA62DRAFT_696394 [Auriculariales sp. MPI-PUGE-AT-0066]|nr:hypothetical protein BKA62DRAFT_696394 [Auriculariales sp. MPI-PUGE-AT-0066]